MSRESILEQMQSDPDDPRHGAPTGYQYGCRCPRCREAHRVDAAERRRARKEYERARRRHGA